MPRQYIDYDDQSWLGYSGLFFKVTASGGRGKNVRQYFLLDNYEVDFVGIPEVRLRDDTEVLFQTDRDFPRCIGKGLSAEDNRMTFRTHWEGQENVFVLVKGGQSFVFPLSQLLERHFLVVNVPERARQLPETAAA